MVDIYFPVLDLTCNAGVDENSKISALVREIGEMMCKRYRSVFDGEKDSYMLCSLDEKRILSAQETLSSCRIGNGSRLMLL